MNLFTNTHQVEEVPIQESRGATVGRESITTGVLGGYPAEAREHSQTAVLHFALHVEIEKLREQQQER